MAEKLEEYSDIDMEVYCYKMMFSDRDEESNSDVSMPTLRDSLPFLYIPKVFKDAIDMVTNTKAGCGCGCSSEAMDVENQLSDHLAKQRSVKIRKINGVVILAILFTLVQIMCRLLTGQLKMSVARRYTFAITTWVAIVTLFTGLVLRRESQHRRLLSDVLRAVGFVFGFGAILCAFPLCLPMSIRLVVDIVDIFCVLFAAVAMIQYRV